MFPRIGRPRLKLMSVILPSFDKTKVFLTEGDSILQHQSLFGNGK